MAQLGKGYQSTWNHWGKGQENEDEGSQWKTNKGKRISIKKLEKKEER